MGWLFLLLIAAFFLGPLAVLGLQIDGAALKEVAESGNLGRVLRVTIVTGLGGACLSVLAGTYFARKFALYDWRGKRAQRLALLLPYLVPNFVLASAYVAAWNPGTGLLNPVMGFPFSLYGVWGMTLLFAVAHVPVAFLLAESKIKRIDSSLREAATLSGASSWEVFTRIELPLLKPVLVAALGLCFSLNVSAFAIPAWIGAPGRAYPLTYRIYQAIQVGGPEGIPRAAVYSLILFALAIPPLLLSAWAARNERIYAVVSGKAAKAGISKAGPLSFGMFQLAFWASLGVLFAAPVFTLFLTTLVKPGCLQMSGMACFGDVSLRSYRYVLFELSETRAAFHASFLYGSIAAAAIMALVMLTLAFVGRRPAQLKVSEWIFALPVATPGAIIALALIVTYSGGYGINLYNTAWIVVVAFIVKHLNLAFQPVRTGLSNISGSLLEAARLSGARPDQVWGRIVLPILRPEIVGGFFLILIPILGELTMSIFLSSPSFRSIGTVLFDLQDYADQASAAALSIILIVVILALNEAARFLSRGKLGY